jgi:uncharacterized membrane protein
MFLFLAFNFLIGLLGGFILEFSYRSFKTKKIIRPQFPNLLMYGLAAVFLGILYFLDISLVFKFVFMFIFPTLVEFIVGYSYLKIKKSYLWDYIDKPFNFMNLICLEFSLYWFALAAFYYFLVLPLLIGLK